MQLARQLARHQTCLRQTAGSSSNSTPLARPIPSVRRSGRFAAAAAENEVKTSEPSDGKSQAEITTEKYGLEAGLYQVLTSKQEGDSSSEAPISRTEQAKRLLAQYGSAYLITSISFAIVSFAACYAAVSAGVDVASLLSKVGLSVNDTSEKVGTFAIAYAAHKALSPVRFPPTVALTPVVARWTGKAKQQQQEEQPPSNNGSSSSGNGAN